MRLFTLCFSITGSLTFLASFTPGIRRFLAVPGFLGACIPGTLVNLPLVECINPLHCCNNWAADPPRNAGHLALLEILELFHSWDFLFPITSGISRSLAFLDFTPGIPGPLAFLDLF